LLSAALGLPRRGGTAGTPPLETARTIFLGDFVADVARMGAWGGGDRRSIDRT
jgi:hypothetical protein